MQDAATGPCPSPPGVAPGAMRKRQITGEELRMKESYGEGLASHTGPESCASGREAAGEALTGVRAGWVLSLETPNSGVPTPCMERERPHRGPRRTPEVRGPRGVRDPKHARKLPAQELGDPAFGPATRNGVRVMNPQRARWR